MNCLLFFVLSFLPSTIRGLDLMRLYDQYNKREGDLLGEQILANGAQIRADVSRRLVAFCLDSVAANLLLSSPQM